MIAPNKLIGNVTSLQNFSTPGQAGVITTHHGAILEANAETALLLNMASHDAMRNALIMSYAHRASVRGMHEAIKRMTKSNNYESKDLKLRPRSGIPFQANIKARVIVRNEGMFLIFWELSNAEVVKPSGEWNLKTGT